jgi:hypothetical protein
MSDEFIYLNGIDSETEWYFVDPLSPSGAVAAVRGKPPQSGLAGWLGQQRGGLGSPFLGLPRDLDPNAWAGPIRRFSDWPSLTESSRSGSGAGQISPR